MRDITVSPQTGEYNCDEHDYSYHRYRYEKKDCGGIVGTHDAQEEKRMVV